VAESLPKAKKVEEESKPIDSKQVEDWIRQIGEKVEKTGHPICPYAKKSIQQKSIQIQNARHNVLDQCLQYCDLFGALGLDAVVIYFNYPISEKKLSNLARRVHRLRSNFAVLYDHPKNKGLHKGIQFSFQKAPLLIMQEYRKLKHAQTQLKKTDYYRAWGLEHDQDMFI
jgi:hypothetical protein